MNFSLLSIERDGIVRVAVEGDMTSAEFSSDAAHPLATLLGQQWSQNRIVLSFDQTQYMDSSAIGWLLSCQKQVQRDGGSLVIHSVPASIMQIFDMLKINRVLTMADDEAAALKAVRGDN